MLPRVYYLYLQSPAPSLTIPRLILDMYALTRLSLLASTIAGVLAAPQPSAALEAETETVEHIVLKRDAFLTPRDMELAKRHGADIETSKTPSATYTPMWLSELSADNLQCSATASRSGPTATT